jgi:(1->4)-alpha-D-glucan 1-alpha-D-glucosylmutase
VREAKRRILARNLAGELEVLKDFAKALAERDPATRDHGADSLRRAILEFAAALPVYRSYVNVEGPSEADLSLIADAAAAVRAAREVEDEGAIDFVSRMLRLDFPDPDLQGAALVFATRFQQTTGPVTAKAVEDTVFYRYNRLIALNEVGGDPQRFGAPVEAFHREMTARSAAQPGGLSATATHDTKRGEDARARLYALSEMADAWRAAVAAWNSRLAHLRRDIDGLAAPEPEMEWLFYQALAGAWEASLEPADSAGVASLAERMAAYMLKVVREAKLRTSWTSPAAEYENAVSTFVAGALADAEFLADFSRRIAPLLVAGALNALSQLAVKLAAPGVPDIYQGTELWDFSLVDPDNRRAVDFALRAGLLSAIGAATPEALLADWRGGRPKLRLLAAGLRLRRDMPALFAEGEYVPLAAHGERADRLVAFARRREGAWLVAFAPRLALPLLAGCSKPIVPAERWEDTAVPLPAEAGTLAWRDAVTGARVGPTRRLRAADVLARFPVALLGSDSPG